MSTELVVRDEASLAFGGNTPAERVRAAMVVLREMQTPAEVNEFHGMAAAAEVYAKARASLEDYFVIAEIRLRTEKYAGEFRALIPRQRGGKGPRSNLGEFDKEFGISRMRASIWEGLSKIPEARFAELIRSARDRDGSFSAYAILRRDGRSYDKRIEPGIYLLRDGRLAIKWTKDGVTRYKILDTNDLTKARKALALVRGTIKEQHIRGGKTIGEAQEFVKKALITLANLPGKPESDARLAIQTATAHLHKAEDELVKASLLV